MLFRYFSRCMLIVLTAAFFSVFSFNGVARADSIVGNRTLINKQAHKIDRKSNELNDVSQSIQQLILKKITLKQKLSSEKKTINNLNQKLAKKRIEARTERARVRALKNMFVHITRSAPDSAGNLYDPGNCTWYVKNRRPDLPNNLGNANTWYSMAASDGYHVGLSPKKGAVGTTTVGYWGHVVYVEGVSLDGRTVTISEMNYAGLYSLRTRTTLASEFKYIYEL